MYLFARRNTTHDIGIQLMEPTTSERDLHPVVIQPQLNREGWLTELAKRSERFFVNTKLSPYRVTVGWPLGGALSKKKRILGQCFASEVSAGKIHEIFITPLIHDASEVAGVLMHEMTHVAAGIKAGHKGHFIKVAQRIGLTKNKPTQAMPGDWLQERLDKLLGTMGKYPHSPIIPTAKEKTKEQKAVTMECDGCECKIRITTKWLENSGTPTCGCGTEFVLKGLEDK